MVERDAVSEAAPTLELRSRDDRQRRPALAGSIGAALAPTVSMISLLSIPCR
jgi:hypothetical protein